MMTKKEMSLAILTAKKAKKVTWTALAQVVGLSEVYTTSACLGENHLSIEEAEKLTDYLDLSSEVALTLTEYANKGENAPAVSKEPLQYRLQEVIYVYGETLKVLIEEKFGAGIMSAIDFSMDIQKQEDPKGDRVVITMNGKFLPYKRF